MTSKPAVRVSTIKPGVLVALRTSIRGNVQYEKQNLNEGVLPGGAAVREWETKRTVYDPAEYERAVKVRQKARNTIALACVVSSYGLLCPTENQDALDTAVREARKVVREFNANAKLTSVSLNVFGARIADNDVEAARAIGNELNDLMRAMERGVAKLDVEGIRKAATAALQVSNMVSPGMQERVTDFVKQARDLATKINKNAEVAAKEIDAATMQVLASKRTAFLEIGEFEEVEGPRAAAGRALDFTPEAEVPATTAKRETRRVEIEEAPADAGAETKTPKTARKAHKGKIIADKAKAIKEEAKINKRPRRKMRPAAPVPEFA